MLRVYIKPPGDDWVEYTPIVRADREFEIGGRAYNGEADQGTITIDDPDNTLDEVTEFGGHREVKITVDDSGSEKVLALGRIGPKSLERGQHPLGRELTLTIEDVNAELRGISVDKWNRPSETGRTRVAALRLAYLRGSLSTRSAARDSTNIDIDDFFPDALTETMPAKAYEGTDPLSVIRECAEFEGKLTFVYPQDNGDKELFYAVPNDLTLHNCTLEVSDDSADVDDDTVFAPWWNAGPALSSDPMETITGLTLIHPDGQRTYDNLPAAEVMFDKWEESMFTELAPGALADTQMASILNARDHEEKRRQFSLRLPESKVHLIKQGMLLHIIKADAANVPDGGGGSQKYRIGQIRYRWHGPDATDDNAFLVIVTLEATTKLKLRHGRRAQATKAPPTPRPAPEVEPQPEDTLTAIACWDYDTDILDETDTYLGPGSWHGSAHSVMGAGHGDIGNSGDQSQAVPATAGGTVNVTMDFRWKWGPATRPIYVKFWSGPDPSGLIETWVFETGAGRAVDTLYHLAGSHPVPVGASWATVTFPPFHGLSLIDNLCINSLDAADVVENDPAAVEYGPDCPHDSPHFLPSDWVICQLERVNDQVSAAAQPFGWFNVRDYDAVGDGTTDDTAEINDAIAALNTAGGGVLYFPAGTYLCSDALTTISVPCTVLGDATGGFPYASGVGSKVLQSSATANLFSFSDDGWSIRDLTLDNSSGSTPSAGAGISSGNAYFARMQNVSVSGFYDNIDISDGAGWSLTDSFVHSPVRYGLRIRGTVSPDSGDQSISGCYFMADAHNATAAIRQESAGGLKIVNTKINDRGVAPNGKFVDGISVSIASSAVSTSILLIANSSIENISGDAIDIETLTTGRLYAIQLSNVQAGLYSNNAGRAVKIAAATNGVVVDGSISAVTITGCTFRTDGTARSAMEFTNLEGVSLAAIQLLGFNDLYTGSGNTNVTEVGSVPDHGALTGLSDDDHTQYLNDARHTTTDHSAVVESAGRWEPVTNGVDTFVWDGAEIVVHFVET